MDELGRSFDRAAAEYERGRPGWPDAVLDVVPVAADADVVDLAAGTGKLTRVLVRRYRVVAVEPLDAVREILARAVPAAVVAEGRAESMPLADASADAVFVAQAFHWFANNEAVAEIARVLRPGGTLVLLWNGPRPEASSPLPQAYRERSDALRAEATLPAPDWQAVLARGPFGKLQATHVDHEQRSSRAEVLAFAASQSWIAYRADRARVLEELGALLPDDDYRFPIRAEVHWTVRA